ncbi:MAG: tRNA lysidine(34) synthetase TilS [Campylobacterota bacterium]|nr:tRNA lysidine(34) synthetase TilS [Campylobacterota bacterium]
MNNINIDITTQNNLLAFSGGIDSSALFFLMIEKNIPFDIAIVDYNQREQSKDEVIYATQLAHKYNKKCFISTYPENLKFSEKEARDFRHNFFDDIIKTNNYETLITAHQLNDKLEWFLMQFTKGAGVTELIGMKEISYKNSYKVLKPLLKYSKEELLEYLESNNLKYFIDSSNKDLKYKRNYFRHTFSEKLLQEYKGGISKSFEYLENDNNSLMQNIEIKKIKELSIYKYNNDKNIAIRLIDKDLKQRGIIISKATRDEIIDKKELIISHKISVSIIENYIYISPISKVIIDKKSKEIYRKNKIPKNIRAYIFENNINSQHFF